MRKANPALRSQFAWTFAGNAVNAASQWAVLSVIAKLGSQEMLGEYALALAIAYPPAMLSHLNLRAVVATDTRGQHSFGEYLWVRIAASAAGFLLIVCLGVAAGGTASLRWAVAWIALSLVAEAFSDLHHGWMQRRERLDLVARSMIARAALTIVAGAAAVWAFGSAAAAAAAVAMARVATLLALDSRWSGAPWTVERARPGIWRAALPLGAVLMLGSLTANLPRYAAEVHLGTKAVGALAAVASFVTVGTTMVNALGQSATTRLAKAFAAGDRRTFRTLALKVAATVAGIGAAGTAVAAVAGGFFLELLYRREFREYAPVLVAMMAAGTAMYVAMTIGFLVTSTRRFFAQIPLLATTAAVCAVVSFAAMPRMGLFGAAVAIGSASCVQIAGGLFLLSRDS